MPNPPASAAQAAALNNGFGGSLLGGSASSWAAAPGCAATQQSRGPAAVQAPCTGPLRLPIQACAAQPAYGCCWAKGQGKGKVAVTSGAYGQGKGKGKVVMTGVMTTTNTTNAAQPWAYGKGKGKVVMQAAAAGPAALGLGSPGFTNRQEVTGVPTRPPLATYGSAYVVKTAPLMMTAPMKSVPAGLGIKRLPRQGEAKDAKLAAVIVTICSGHSYDDMFQEVQQQGPQGTTVATYAAEARDLPILLQALKSGSQLGSALANNGLPQDAVAIIKTALAGSAVEQLCRDLNSVDPASVVFNWECCSGCEASSFGQESEAVLELIELLIERGHMVMCSDFSLKALIKEWNEQRLGPNPFVQLGEFGGCMSLGFEPQALKACPSAQLQKVGEMCDDGVVGVQALQQTIVYTVDQDRLQGNDHYMLEVLSVVTNAPGSYVLDGYRSLQPLPPNLECAIGDMRGTAGHVLLRYPSGGLLMASAGHWLELVNINVSEERLMTVVERTYGEAFSSSVREQLRSSAGDARRSLTQQFASQVIQQSCPSSYSVRPEPS